MSKLQVWKGNTIQWICQRSTDIPNELWSKYAILYEYIQIRRWNKSERVFHWQNRTTIDGRRWRLICSIIFCVQSPYPTLLKIGETCWFTRWYTWMNPLSVIPWIWFTPKPCLSTNMRAILMRWHAFMSQNRQHLLLFV